MAMLHARDDRARPLRLRPDAERERNVDDRFATPAAAHHRPRFEFACRPTPRCRLTVDVMQHRALLFALLVAVSMTACDQPSRPRTAGAQTRSTNEEPAAGGVAAGKEVVYRSVRLVVPAAWPVQNEHTPCPAFDEVGLFIVDPVTDTGSCGRLAPVNDG